MTRDLGRSPSYKLAFSLEEASELLSVSRSQLYRLIDMGELKSVTIGKSRRVTRQQLDEFLRKLEQTGGTGRLP
jgi:excisionase family DNA binding protein